MLNFLSPVMLESSEKDEEWWPMVFPLVLPIEESLFLLGSLSITQDLWMSVHLCKASFNFIYST